MWFSWEKRQRLGHIVTVEFPSAKQNNGMPIVIDSQSGKIMPLSEYLRKKPVKIGTISVYRVDNLNIDMASIHDVIRKAVR